MGHSGFRGFRGPRDHALRRALGLGLLIFVFGMMFSMLICKVFLQWLVIIGLLALAIWLLMQSDW